MSMKLGQTTGYILPGYETENQINADHFEEQFLSASDVVSTKQIDFIYFKEIPIYFQLYHSGKYQDLIPKAEQDLLLKEEKHLNTQIYRRDRSRLKFILGNAYLKQYMTSTYQEKQKTRQNLNTAIKYLSSEEGPETFTAKAQRLNNLGCCYCLLKENSQAFKCLEAALVLYQDNRQLNMSCIYQNIAHFYYQNEMYEQAVHFYLSVSESLKTTNWSNSISKMNRLTIYYYMLKCCVLVKKNPKNLDTIINLCKHQIEQSKGKANQQSLGLERIKIKMAFQLMKLYVKLNNKQKVEDQCKFITNAEDIAKLSREVRFIQAEAMYLYLNLYAKDEKNFNLCLQEAEKYYKEALKMKKTEKALEDEDIMTVNMIDQNQ